MRKLFELLCICMSICLLFAQITVFAEAESSAQIYINGEAVATGILQNDRTFVPIRFLSEALGYSVAWDGDTQKVSVTNGEITNVMYIGTQTACRYTAEAQEEILMDVAPMLIDARTYVPLRYVAESLNCGVLWQGESQSVHLTEKVLLALNGFSFSPIDLNEEIALLQFGRPYDTIAGPDGVRRYIYLDASGILTVFGFYDGQLFDFFTSDASAEYNGMLLSSFDSGMQLPKSTYVFYDALKENKAVALYHCIAGRTYNAYTADADKAEAMRTEAKLCYYLTNALRRSFGVSDLIFSNALAEADRAHVADMAEQNFFSHTGLHGEGIKERLSAVPGYANYKYAGEVLAKMPNAYHAVYGWLNSPAHREAVLDDKYIYTGICVDGKQMGHLYFAQVLVKLK